MMSVYFRRLARASILLAAASAMTPSAQAAAPAEIVVQGERVYPESLTSASDGTVIIGGLGSHAIYRAKPGSAAAEDYWSLAAWLRNFVASADLSYGGVRWSER